MNKHEEIIVKPAQRLFKTLQEVCRYVCLKCGHTWVSRLPLNVTPRQCPRCKNSRWQKGPKIKGMGRPKKAGGEHNGKV